MGLREEDLKRAAAAVRLEQCIRPGNVLARVLDRVRSGEPFLLTETDRDEMGTIPMPGAVHVRVERGGQQRWMALVFQITANAGRLMREARRRVRLTRRAVILREEESAPVLLRGYASEPGLGTLLTMRLEEGGLEFEAAGYLARVVAAHEIIESAYGLAVLAGRLKRGMPVEVAG